MNRYFILMLLVFGLVFTSAPLLSAQEMVTEEFTLEEITVTAQKREENQQKVPITMEVITGDEMRELGYNNLDEIISTMSTAFINTAGDGMRVSIRGMSDDIRASGSLSDMSVSTPTVAVNVDGVYTSRRNSGSGLYDMERVEVLYGPQSTLYSTSSPGGIVNIVTANPKTDKYEASATLEYGNYNLLHTEGSMNLPINDIMALRFAFNTSVHDGYMANGSDDEDIKSARIKALLQPNDRLTAVFTGEYTKTGGNGYSGITMFTSQDELADPWDNSDDDTPVPRYSDSKKISGDVDWDMGLGTLSVITSYAKDSSFATMTREDMSTGETYSQSMDRDGTEKGIELRMASSADSFLKWIIGGNYYRSDVNQMDMPETEEYEYRETNEKTKAVYGNITYPASDRVRLNGGVRYTEDTNYLVEYMIKGEGLVENVTATEYSDPDFKVGVEYDLAENSMLYADWSSSYRSVGAANAKLDPERLTAYTVGSKNRFYGNKLQVNASAFYYDYTDYVADFGRVSDPNNYDRSDDGSSTNGDYRKYGVDLQTSAIITSKDKLNLSISYLNSEFTRLCFDFENDLFEDMDFTGKPDTFSPEWTININYSHNFSLPNGGALTTRIDTRYQSDYLVNYIDVYQEMDDDGNALYSFLSRADYTTQEAHHISNFSMIYANPDGQWTLTSYVKNIENYAEKKNLMNDSMMIGSPRTYGGVLTVRF